ncbi:MAG: hypothetical protein B7Y88_11450 [Sphingomonadales bacterium 32-64-17]|nr:MAG: hypothetical protein B7Y88_11450 [Sphingomonadales bacterium 32-64-17]
MTAERDQRALSAIAADPRYQALVSARARLGWWLSAVVFFCFVGYLLLIAFDKALLAMPIGGGVTSLGIPVGLGLIVLAIVLTGVYVAIANRRFDSQMAEILRSHGA